MVELWFNEGGEGRLGFHGKGGEAKTREGALVGLHGPRERREGRRFGLAAAVADGRKEGRSPSGFGVTERERAGQGGREEKERREGVVLNGCFKIRARIDPKVQTNSEF